MSEPKQRVTAENNCSLDSCNYRCGCSSAAIAYAVYCFFTPDYLEDFEEDFDDDFDNDFFSDEDEVQ